MKASLSKCPNGFEPGKPGAQSGVVLLTVVLMIALLGVLVIQYNYLSGLDVMMAAGARDSTDAFFLAQAGLNQAILKLQEDKLSDLAGDKDEDEDGGRREPVRGEQDDSGVDSLFDIWAAEQDDWITVTKDGDITQQYCFKIVDEDRKFNINLILEDGVADVAAARLLAAGGAGEGEADSGETTREERERAREAERERRAAETRLEKREGKEEIEIDRDSREYRSLRLLLEKIRGLADAADGIDPFARRLFDTPAGTLDRLVEWFEDKRVGPGEFERSGPMETIGELALLPGMSREMMSGTPWRGPSRRGEGGLELIDPWAPEPFRGLQNYLTVYGDGKVNINTAPREVLEVMLQDENDDQSVLAADIIAARENLPFARVEDINDDEYLRERMLGKFADKFKVSSEYFTIESGGRVGKVENNEFEGTVVWIRAVVQRQENRIVICYWRVEE